MKMMKKQMSKQTDKKNIPPGKKTIPGKKITPKPPKFNIMWLWMAMLLGFFVLQYMFSGEAPKTISYKQFEQEMLIPGDVDSIVAYKKNDLYVVEVYIKKEKLSLDKYKNVKPKENGFSLTPSI